MKRRLLIPEVIQSSAMDCGPACLKALFAGFDTYLSYGRLREACQTDVDGTSIDTLEDTAIKLGMKAAQSMLAADHLLLEESASLPAIVVTRTPGGATHFVVVWRLLGPWVQVMDPAAGRLWLKRDQFLESLHVHEQSVPVAAWQEWSKSASFTASIQQRARALQLPTDLWADGAHQDAALRLAGTLRDQGHLAAGSEGKFLALCAEQPEQIPLEYWMARPDPGDAHAVILRGAVLLTIAGGAEPGSAREPLPDSLARVRAEPEPRVWHIVSRALFAGGGALPLATAIALCSAALGTVLEALLFRGLIDVWRHLESGALRFAALAGSVALLAILLFLDWGAFRGLMILGRRLEVHLRMHFMLKIPRLGDRYLQSRLLSDMAYRAHSLHALRQMPAGIGRCLQLLAATVMTGIAIALVYPGSWVLICCGLALSCAAPLLSLPAALERDLRSRELSASLSSLYLDSLLGSRAIQAHSAQSTLIARQAQQLTEWVRAARHKLSLSVRVGALETILTTGFVVALVFTQANLVKNPAGLLLLVYWALSLTQLCSNLASGVLQLPRMQNLLLRFLEPLGAPDEGGGAVTGLSNSHGVRIELQQASVVVAGRSVLDAVTLRIEPGEHIAIVGVSGAGKSTLLGCLLGWYQPAAGSLLVDGQPLDSQRLALLRHQTAWVDPQVHLLRATLFENLRYGNEATAPSGVGKTVAAAEIGRILKHWPQGLQTPLGEGGTMLSGGEGQRVRLARALGRPDIRLALLDEAARGLGREDRRRLLRTARAHFSNATLICVTHDVADTRSFDRVLVIEQGRIIEDGAPSMLERRCDSRYRALLDAETTVERELWSARSWRRLRMVDGALHENTESIA